MKVIEYERVSLSDMEHFKTVVNTPTTDHNYSLLSRNNLRQPIQMNLSQKQDIFLNCFVDFSKLHEILNISKKS